MTREEIYALGYQVMLSMDKRDFLEPKDAAKKLGVSPALLSKMRMRKEGPKYIAIGARISYRPLDIDLWLDEQKQKKQDEQEIIDEH